MIWIYLLVLLIIPAAISTDGFTTKIMPKSNKNAYSQTWKAFYHLSVTVPIILLIIMYLVLIYILKDKSANESEITSKKRKSLAKMTTAIVVTTLICYVPFIAFKQYRYMIVDLVGYIRAAAITNSTAGVS